VVVAISAIGWFLDRVGIANPVAAAADGILARDDTDLATPEITDHLTHTWNTHQQHQRRIPPSNDDPATEPPPF
jgi:hypothetical protein